MGYPQVSHHFGDVSENEEEEISDSSFEKEKSNYKNQITKKTYSIGYLTKKIWSNKIYSDDFDADFETIENKKSMRFKLGSALNSAIQEDVESEIENPYFSDNSSFSQLTSKHRKFSMELSKLLDKSDNESYSVRSVGGGKQKYLHSALNEPIYEEEDEKDELADQGSKLIS